MGLAAVRDLRELRAPTTQEDLASFETDVLSGFVLAQHPQQARPDLAENRPRIEPTTPGYLACNLRRNGVDLEHVRKDQILHEALTTG